TYDGHSFTLTGRPNDQKAVPPPPVDPKRFDPPCPTPAGGWQVVDPSKVALANFQDISSRPRSLADFAGLWVGHVPASGGPATVGQPTVDVYTIAFTRNLAEHEAEIRTFWGGPICVTQLPRSYAALAAASTRLRRLAPQLHLTVLVAGTDDRSNQITAEVVLATPADQRKVDATFGRGIIHLTSALQRTK
ncbi:MAG TPA: hypothetical protein VGM93_00215, partial [Acidimicrobiales bacterium]